LLEEIDDILIFHLSEEFSLNKYNHLANVTAAYEHRPIGMRTRGEWGKGRYDVTHRSM